MVGNIRRLCTKTLAGKPSLTTGAINFFLHLNCPLTAEMKNAGLVLGKNFSD